MTAPGLRVLIVSPALPSTSWGFGTRVFHLANQLAHRHSVTVLAYGRRRDQAAAEVRHGTGWDLRVVPRERRRGAKRSTQLTSLVSTTPFACRDVHTDLMQRSIDEATSAEPFDVVQVESSQLCTFRFPSGAAVVLDEHNVEYELLERMGEGERTPFRRMYNRLEHAKLRRFELSCWRRVDACAMTSEREVAIVRRHAPATPAAAVPNAVDLDFFAPAPGPVDPDAIVFTGLLTYRPNLDGARFLVQEILPRVRREHPRATVTIVGHGTPGDLDSLRGPGVTVTGWVPDIRPYVARAALAAVPIRMGGGTRLKVLEALAMAKPVVSTAIGCEGIGVHDREHLSIGDGAEAFAQRTVELLSRPGVARTLGVAGRSLVASEYSWERAGACLEELYQAALQGTGRDTEAALTGPGERHGA